MFEHAPRTACDAEDETGPVCVSLAPVWRADARVLVLGSMPGVRSLEVRHYYAHPRNAFWSIIEAALGVPADAPYLQRLDGLIESGVALWDVIGSCRRRGSLDQRIEAESIEPNDLGGLLRCCPGVRRIAFNGAAAEAAFRRHVLPVLDADLARIERHRLPSTSPAHAAMGRADKIAAWRPVLER